MNQEQDFLQTIIDDPDDDAARLIYADWLDECGQSARAEFIRLQIELSNAPDEDPRKPLLHSRERELLEEHQAEWMGRLAQHLTGWRFQRGFVDAIDVDASALVGQAAPLLDGVPVRSINLHQASGWETALAGCSCLRNFQELVINESTPVDLSLFGPQLKRVKHLSLSTQTIDVPTINALADSGIRLTHLRLSHCALGVGPLEALVTSDALEGVTDLSLTGCELSNVGVEMLAHSLRSSALRRLALVKNGIGETGARTLARMPQLGQLIELDLSQNELGNAGAVILFTSPSFRALRRLTLQKTRMSARAAIALAGSEHIRNLTFLDLSSNQIGEEGAKALAASPNLAALAELVLTGNEIGDVGAEALGKSTHLGSIRRLGLGVNGIRVAGVRGLVGTGNLPQLRSLDLSSNCFGDLGAQVLAHWPHLRQLRSLRLASNKIGLVGIKDLVASRHLPGLRELDLAGNYIDDPAAVALFESPLARQLTSLNLQATDLTANSLPALTSLLAASPRLQVGLAETDLAGADLDRARAVYPVRS